MHGVQLQATGTINYLKNENLQTQATPEFLQSF